MDAHRQGQPHLMSAKAKIRGREFVQSLLDRPLPCLTGEGPDADVVLSTHGRLMRNLEDFPFPVQCSDHEKKSIADQVCNALKHEGILEQGVYCNAEELEGRELRLLKERGLISEQFSEGFGPRGVFIAQDQRMSIMVNCVDHIQIYVSTPGLQPQDVANRLLAVDEVLTRHLAFAFDNELGYLTAVVSNVGTGMRLKAAAHLPGLSASNAILTTEQQVREQRHTFDGVHGAVKEARGDLFSIANAATLGRSEEEIAFHLKHLVTDLAEREREARSHMLSESRQSVEDRVGRAQGIARGARILEWTEALALLSSLRLGTAAGLLAGYTPQQLNELELLAQPGHLEVRKGHECDAFELCAERATVFRTQLA